MKGTAYKFRQKSSKVHTSGTLGKTANYSFIGVVKGRGIDLFLFVSASGKWLETFTAYQLADYQIERVV
jgi:hypothetical protein